MQRASIVIIGIAILVLAAFIGFLLLSPPAEPGASPSARPSASPQPSPSASLNAEMMERRWTVLFVGTDLNERREAEGAPVNADAIMLASLSADQEQLTLVSLPRDTVDIPLPDGGTWERKVNALYPEQGVEGLRTAVEELFGVPIDAHVVLDMDDVARLIEAAGGVEVDPSEPLTDPIVSLDLQPGPQELNAETALGYVRSRVDQDYGRMRRQQEVILSLVERLTDPERAIDVRPLIDGLESLETDLPIEEELPTLLELARRAGDADVERLIIEPPLITFEGDRNDGRGYILEPDVEAIRDAVGDLIPD